jgi:hypothetical protein
MHYKNGREAKVGDVLIQRVGPIVSANVIVSITPGTESCNACVVPVNANAFSYVTLKDCLHADDVLPA